jgi:hypothetical protein
MVTIEFTGSMIAMFTAKDSHYDSVDETMIMILSEARAFHWIQIKNSQRILWQKTKRTT